jgi:transposase-like protein
MNDHSRRSAREVWAERIKRFEYASQTVAEFCSDEGVSPASFYQWRRRLRSEVTPTETTARFVPVQLPSATPEETTTVMSVELPGGVRVRLEVTGNAADQA